jgi:hypothetical protein
MLPAHEYEMYETYPCQHSVTAVRAWHFRDSGPHKMTLLPRRYARPAATLSQTVKHTVKALFPKRCFSCMHRR